MNESINRYDVVLSDQICFVCYKKSLPKCIKKLKNDFPGLKSSDIVDIKCNQTSINKIYLRYQLDLYLNGSEENKNN